jgi:tRNA(Arg) A34 adenosine deaminase TadA
MINVVDLGKEYLKTISSTNTAIIRWKSKLEAYNHLKDCIDDSCAWLTCVLALKAVHMGNFGVGCVLIDSNNNIVVQGHNHVFNPYFRSDRHAEMVVMDEFEDTHREVKSMSAYTIYTSLESCPMCTSRLITSRVGRVLHVAPDTDGGMVHLLNNLPNICRNLVSGQEFRQAKCSPHMINAAEEIFSINVSELTLKLQNR